MIEVLTWPMLGANVEEKSTGNNLIHVYLINVTISAICSSFVQLQNLCFMAL